MWHKQQLAIFLTLALRREHPILACMISGQVHADVLLAQTERSCWTIVVTCSVVVLVSGCGLLGGLLSVFGAFLTNLARLNV